MTMPDIIKLNAYVVIDSDLMAGDGLGPTIDKGPNDLTGCGGAWKLAGKYRLPVNTGTVRFPLGRTKEVRTKAAKNAGCTA
jgi:hypothetical protein